MTLFLPQPSHPQNALAIATVRLWNSTSAPMQVEEPEVDVLWPSGRIAYSYFQGGYPAGVVSTGPPNLLPKVGLPAPITLRPRQAVARHLFVIVRSGRLRAISAVFTDGGARSIPVRTGILYVRLGRAPYPRVTIARQDGTVVATIAPTSPRQAGTLWYMSAEGCSPSAGDTGTPTWTRVPYSDRRPDGSYQFPAPRTHNCVTPQRWSLAAGWLSQPVAAANYAS
jgi:hypothetical protein